MPPGAETDPREQMPRGNSADEPLARLRMRGDAPEHDEYRSRLHACAQAHDPDEALSVLAEMEAVGFPATSDDHLLVLVAHQLGSRDEDAEAYLRTLPPGVVTAAHLHAVLAVYAFNRRPDDVERLYREFEAGPVPPNDGCRLVVLTALSFARDHTRAAELFTQWAPSRERDAYPAMLGRLIDAHGHPGAHDELVALYDALDDHQRQFPEVTGALVEAFARAGDAERAEACLEPALDAVDDDDTRAELVGSCIHAYRQQVLPAIERIVNLAEARDIDLDLDYRSVIEPAQGRWL